MTNAKLILFLVYTFCLGALVILAAIRYHVSFAKDARHAKNQLHCAPNWKTMVYWKRELSALRWSFLPGLTPDRVKSLRKLFYRGRFSAPDTDDGMSTMLLPSVFGVCLCMVCLAGGTFAWFTASQSTAAQPITTANYSVAISVQTVVSENETGSAESVSPNAQGVYSLSPGEYSVTVTASGTATTGYCKVILDGTEYLTEQTAPGNTLTFTVTVTGDTNATLTVEGRWGSSKEWKNPDISDGKIISRGATAPESGTD